MWTPLWGRYYSAYPAYQWGIGTHWMDGERLDWVGWKSEQWSPEMQFTWRISAVDLSSVPGLVGRGGRQRLKHCNPGTTNMSEAKGFPIANERPDQFGPGYLAERYIREGRLSSVGVRNCKKTMENRSHLIARARPCQGTLPLAHAMSMSLFQILKESIRSLESPFTSLFSNCDWLLDSTGWFCVSSFLIYFLYLLVHIPVTS